MGQITEEREYEAAIKEYGGLISKICFYFSANPEEFNDIRQEVLLNIWKGWKNFRKDSKLSTWIYRVSFNTCISFQRKERRSKNLISIEDLIDIPIDEEPSKLERYNEMHALIRQLNFTERVLILLWLDEKSYEEISALTGLNRNTVAVKLKRIKEKLVNMSKNIGNG